MATFLFRRKAASSGQDRPTDAPEVLGNTAHEELVRSGRYCTALTATPRPEPETLAAAWQELEDKMALVPNGQTTLDPFIPPTGSFSEVPGDQELAVSVDAFYVDRRAVTNDQFARFVQAGGYSDEELWPPGVLAHLLRFVDRTGCAGPRFWSEGKPPAQKGNHPVVGISWYEAHAFARWAGKHLLSAAQWQHAACWSSPDTGHAAAGYPWGTRFDPKRANTWAGGVADTAPVDAYYEGSTANGVYQLIGNVWEWVAQAPEDSAADGRCLLFDQPMGEIRGGAFDTYLETQATCRFRSCQPLLYRGANIGFRCCIPLNELPSPPDPSAFF